MQYLCHAIVLLNYRGFFVLHTVGLWKVLPEIIELEPQKFKWSYIAVIKDYLPLI